MARAVLGCSYKGMGDVMRRVVLLLLVAVAVGYPIFKVIDVTLWGMDSGDEACLLADIARALPGRTPEISWVHEFGYALQRCFDDSIYWIAIVLLLTCHRVQQLRKVSGGAKINIFGLILLVVYAAWYVVTVYYEPGTFFAYKLKKTGFRLGLEWMQGLLSVSAVGLAGYYLAEYVECLRARVPKDREVLGAMRQIGYTPFLVAVLFVGAIDFAGEKLPSHDVMPLVLAQLFVFAGGFPLALMYGKTRIPGL